MVYRYQAASVPGFIQQLAVAYVTHGYYFYVAGHIPPGKPPERVDRVLLERYDIALSRWQRARRKLAGRANLHYLRYEGFYVLIATKGEHEFFERESTVIRDIRRHPISFAGYSVGLGTDPHGRVHVSVRIAPEEYRWLKRFMVQFGRNASAEEVAQEFRMLRFEPYRPVVRQVLSVLRAVNRTRKQAGLEVVSSECVRMRRRVLRPFDDMPVARTA